MSTDWEWADVVDGYCTTYHTLAAQNSSVGSLFDRNNSVSNTTLNEIAVQLAVYAGPDLEEILRWGLSYRLALNVSRVVCEDGKMVPRTTIQKVIEARVEEVLRSVKGGKWRYKPGPTRAGSPGYASIVTYATKYLAQRIRTEITKCVKPYPPSPSGPGVYQETLFEDINDCVGKLPSSRKKLWLAVCMGITAESSEKTSTQIRSGMIKSVAQKYNCAERSVQIALKDVGDCLNKKGYKI